MRLYIEEGFVGASQVEIPLKEDQRHYVLNVRRLRVGDSLAVFHESSGQWQGILKQVSKNSLTVVLQEHQKNLVPLSPRRLFFSPLKHEALLILGEKATELGVTDFYPFLSDRSHVRRLNEEKFYRNGIEAAQQCERLEIPRVHPLLCLRESLVAFERYKTREELLWVAVERSETPLFFGALQAYLSSSTTLMPLNVMVGPEGGFSQEDLSFLSRYPWVRFCQLGDLILRAETAALYMLSLCQGLSALNASFQR